MNWQSQKSRATLRDFTATCLFSVAIVVGGYLITEVGESSYGKWAQVVENISEKAP